ncbi:MAG TPA: hypothetical protein VHQ90_05930 [Thermoanaerobaculia bacterium]|nr:hypothetical protein [Thermoanaerobaculia bacterium]
MSGQLREAVLTHVAIWSDLSVPVLNFDVYLTGYDVQTINLRDVIVFGNLPQTAPAGQDPDDSISPKGQLSQDIEVRNCAGKLPPTPLPASFLTHVRSVLTGRPSPMLGNLCAGQSFRDNIARGYITVDTVSRCTPRFPGDPGYFPPGRHDVTDQNLLWGAWYIVDAAQNHAHGSNLVAIEADGADPATSTPGRYTFYGRYNGWSATDHREPLATTFATQYAAEGPFDAGTDLIVWRDRKADQEPFTCPSMPEDPTAWAQLKERVLIFDEKEHAVDPSANPCPIGICPGGTEHRPFPAATQRVHVGAYSYPSLPVPFFFGWFYLDLNAEVATAAGSPPADPKAAQAWVVATMSSHGHFAVAVDAYRLDSACAANHAVP